MYDPDIRKQLIPVLKNIVGDDGIIAEEMNINLGSSRCDIAVLTRDKFVGYEIKSNFDSKKQLANQVEYYSKLFDQAFLVCGPKNLHLFKKLIPDWWGIYTIYETPLGIEFRCRQQQGMNPSVEPAMMITMLWKNELYLTLKSLGLGAGMNRKPWHVLHHTLISVGLDVDETREIVFEHLMKRKNWR